MKLSVKQEVPADYSRSRWSQIVSKIEDAFNAMHSGALVGRTYAAAAPTTGTWAVGDIVYDSAPSAGGTIGWVCVTGGTPGTWKAWGTIAS